MPPPTIDSEPHLQIPRSEKLKRFDLNERRRFPRQNSSSAVSTLVDTATAGSCMALTRRERTPLFEEQDSLGETRIICVQTKSGKINMSSNPSQNIAEITTQLRMALDTKVSRLESRMAFYPDEVILCSSGNINTKARNYIAAQLEKDRRLRFSRRRGDCASH